MLSSSSPLDLPPGQMPSTGWRMSNFCVEETGLCDLQIEQLLNRYGSLLPELLDMIKSSPELAQPLESAPSTSRSKSSTLPPTRAPYTWTTFWRDVPASRSRPGTAV